jgi:hypothetical protein
MSLLERGGEKRKSAGEKGYEGFFRGERKRSGEIFGGERRRGRRGTLTILFYRAS